MVKRTRQTLNIPGFAHGLPTAPLASCRIEAAVGGAVDNPAHWLIDHNPIDDIPFRSPVQQHAGSTSLEIERTTYTGSISRVRGVRSARLADPER